MAPTTQEHVRPATHVLPENDGNRIVISGMSGLYPQSHNVQEFADILYKKENPVTSNIRYEYHHPEVVQHSGTVPDINRFDAQFFRVSYRFAATMDSMSRKLLEQSYQAIYDAGVNPKDLSEKNIGVYISTCLSETDKSVFYDHTSYTGFGIAGCSKSMYANRISYFLNVRGPSICIDDACCGSTAALEQAYHSIKNGHCEAAIVGGASLSLHPQCSVHLGRVITMCKDGKTKVFDENADGCTKSEAICVLFLQKAKDAMRIYANVTKVKTEFICTSSGKMGQKLGFYRNLNESVDFLKNFYVESGLPPQNVEYVEAFGSALPETDKVELETIEEIFCNNRDNTLLVGSIMSNIGYVEAASGICAITKVLLGYHTGELAANLHCEHPRKDIVSLSNGRMRIVTDHQRFNRNYVAVNGLSITGSNSHVLLHGSYKPKDLNKYKSAIPHLVAVSSRHEDAVKYVFENLKSNPIDPEQLALLRKIHRESISGHLGRGFIILQEENKVTTSLAESINYFDDSRRPLWFVYSGMGSQWAGMGLQLMRIPIFAAAIERCRKALEPTGLDIVSIVTDYDDRIFDNILHSFVGIAAIQIGLTDILLELGLKPDGIIGHSVGELGCAYADGCLTAEEMILSAYYRGLVSLETEFIRGSMAAVGMGYEQISQICPPEIEVACHNGPDSSTISGPSDAMRDFVAKLTAQEIFAKEVPCSNIAYHSRYIADAGPGLLSYLKRVLTNPKARSERWISTSVPQASWNEPIAKLCSAEYLTNNLLSPVLFEETSRLLPSNAVLVEVAPHGLLQAILKRSMPASCKNISLTRRKHPNNTVLLLEAIGTLFNEGFNSNIQVLYPKVDMPVSTGTPFLSHLIKWAHDEIWPLPLYRAADRIIGDSCDFIVTLQDKEYSYLRGQSIRGNTLFPYAASLTLVWDTYAMIQGRKRKQISVKFTNILLHAQPIMHDRRQLKLNVSIQSEGNFEVLEGTSIVVEGCIQVSRSDNIEHVRNEIENSNMVFSAEDIYQLFRDRDYFYSDEFQTIEYADESLSDAMLVWRQNWVTFIDGMLQLNALRQPHDAVSQPIYISMLNINLKVHKIFTQLSTTPDGKLLIRANICDKLNSTRCGGVYMKYVQFEYLPPRNKMKMSLNTINLEPNRGFEFYENLKDNAYMPLEDSTLAGENVTLTLGQFSDYNSFKWVKAPQLTGKGVTVNVHYAAINNNDVKQASGDLVFKQNNSDRYGMDFSGLTESGKPVMGIVRTGALSTQVRVRLELLWPVPSHWTLEDAATVPLAYFQACYIFGIKVQLEKGFSVLIHGGAGALGQALIAIALAHDCEVFTTVSDVRKKRFLQKLFPTLKANHIGCSRDDAFEEMVRTLSETEGCKIVVNNVKGDLKNASIRCIPDYGTVVDISQIHNHDDFHFGLANLARNKRYCTVDFFSLFEATNNEEIKVIHTMISEGIVRGYVRPLTRVTYALQEVARAFRLLNASSHRGRVLLRMKDHAVQSQFRLRCNEDHSYVIICNNTTFGIHLADRLVARGAKKLHIHVQWQSPYLQHKTRSWQKLGIDVVVSSENLSKEENVTSLIKNALNSGLLEGVFVTLGDENNNIDQDLIRKLDSEVQKWCADLRHFVVIYFGNNSSGKNVCFNRLRQQLPAIALTMPELKDESYRRCMSWRCAVDAVERVTQRSSGFFLARIESEAKPSILEQIASITGINIDDVQKTVPLKELGLQNDKAAPLCTFLRLQYNLAFSEEEVLLLTINTILETEKSLTDIIPKDKKGLSTFFSYVGTDEFYATTEVVFLPTLVSTVLMRDDEFDSDQTYMCIVSGMEGHFERFRVLCERLKIPAIVLQPGVDNPNETLEELAERFTKVLVKKIGLNRTFYLLGYESGVIVALEMAARLENRGLTGKVFCVGCAPDELGIELKEQLAEYNDEKPLEDEVIKHMYSLMGGCDTTALEYLLQNVCTCSEKVEVAVRTLLGQLPYSGQYARSLIECALARIKHTLNYKISPRRLRSQIILLRAAISQASTQNTVLHHLSEEPVVVHQLNSPLAYITSDLRCTAIINEHLDPEILEEFESRNILNTYLMNGDSYIRMGIN